MSSDAIACLLLPLQNSGTPLPCKGRVLFLRAESHPALLAPIADGPSVADVALAVQGFKPEHERLALAGFEVETRCPPERRFDLALVRITKHRTESLGLIAAAYLSLEPGGLLHVAGAKTEGIESFEKRVRAELGPVESVSKHHARSFWVRRRGKVPAAMLAWQDALKPVRNVEGSFTAAGIFSAGGADAGSRLLAEHLPRDIKGRIADFGAGWGYLSARIAVTCPNVRSIDLYEAEAVALDCARLNLADVGEAGPRIDVLWADVTAADMPAKRYDFIVMNPPFHAGKAQQVSIGHAFVKTAARALKPGGRLLMVANVMLPYERTLATEFSLHRTLVQTQGFRVFEARK